MRIAKAVGMGIKKATVEEVKAGILSLLPPDGTPVPNQNMASMVARHIGKPVTLDLFYEAREALVGTGVAGATKGTVGEIFKEAEATPPGKAAMPWAEREPMRPLERYLEGPFTRSLDAPRSRPAARRCAPRRGAPRRRDRAPRGQVAPRPTQRPG